MGHTGQLSLARRATRRARREVRDLARTTVRADGPDAVRIRHWRGWRSYRLDDPAARHQIGGGRLRLRLPDPAALVRLAASGLLTGEVRQLRVRLASVPEWLVTGVRPPRLGRTAVALRWRRRSGGLTVEFGWSRRYPLHRGLAEVLAAVLRARAWDQVSGPVYELDRSAWLAGAATWPQGRLAAAPPDPAGDHRRPGPFQVPAQPVADLPAPVFTTVANPFGRTLVGAATRYRLQTHPDRLVLQDQAGRTVSPADPAIAKYGVVTVAAAPSPGHRAALQTLAGYGMVFAASDPAVRAALDQWGMVTVDDAAEVDDLPGYALSVAASRRIAVTADAALRRTPLGGQGALPLPAVSVVLSSMRPGHIEQCLEFLAAQTYPALEVLVGLHGYDVPEQTRERWRAIVPFPLRVTAFPAELAFGEVLGRLSRAADGELITKVDDDDHYGRHHVTDLVIAWHSSGAEVAAKGSRFVHLPDREETIDRAWAAPELFDVSPAGGTLLLARSTLQQIGGWSHSPRHVDTDLLIRVKAAGGLVYRTHALEYVYVRRTAGHTWVTEFAELVSQGERSYKGLPAEIIHPHYP